MPIPNYLTISVSGNPPVHKEARYDTTGLQAREGARDTIDRVSTFVWEILREIQVIVINCMGSHSIPCVADPELKYTYILSATFFNGIYYMSNVMSKHVHVT